MISAYYSPFFFVSPCFSHCAWFLNAAFVVYHYRVTRGCIKQLGVNKEHRTSRKGINREEQRASSTIVIYNINVDIQKSKIKRLRISYFSCFSTIHFHSNTYQITLKLRFYFSSDLVKHFTFHYHPHIISTSYSKC